MKSSYFYENSPKSPEIVQSQCKTFLSRLYFSKVMQVIYILLVILCVASILLNFLIESDLSGKTYIASIFLVTLEVLICVLITFEITLRIYLKGFQNCWTFGNITDLTITVLCIAGLIMSLQENILEALGSTACDMIMMFRNVIFLVRLFLVFKHQEETQVSSLEINLNTDEEELVTTSINMAGIKPKYQEMNTFFEEEDDEEKNFKKNISWKGRKIHK